MCVIFFYVNSNPIRGGYKLILASNRDEFYARDTRGVSKWINAQHVYGGIDLEPGREGGTWLAVGGHDGIFKVGALLNLTGEPKPRNAVGRGMIVSNFVSSTDGSTIEAYNQNLYADCIKYNAFNFISIEIGDCATPARIRHCSNVPPKLTEYAEGHCYGFGNSLPETPFEKVLYGQQHFQTIVNTFLNKIAVEHTQRTDNQQHIKLVDDLLMLLKCEQKFWPDAELLKRAPNWGEHLSAINVNVPSEGYGSRTHSIILIDEHNKLHFLEQTMAGLDPNGEWICTNIRKNFFNVQTSD